MYTFLLKYTSQQGISQHDLKSCILWSWYKYVRHWKEFVKRSFTEIKIEERTRRNDATPRSLQIFSHILQINKLWFFNAKNYDLVMPFCRTGFKVELEAELVVVNSEDLISGYFGEWNHIVPHNSAHKIDDQLSTFLKKKCPKLGVNLFCLVTYSNDWWVKSNSSSSIFANRISLTLNLLYWSTELCRWFLDGMLVQLSDVKSHK